METLRWSSKSPIAVIVIAVFVLLLGFLSLAHLPLQLFPDIKRPEMQIQTGWRTASPEEVESELLEPLENVMQGLPGVEEIEGNACRRQARMSACACHRHGHEECARGGDRPAEPTAATATGC